MVEPIQLQGRQAWLKRYAGGSERTLSLAVLDFIASRAGMAPLRPPPHRTGVDARDVEARRLEELAAQHVHVPQVLGHAREALVLSDNGRSLAAWLKGADDAGRDRLVSLALAAIAKAHAGGAYFGQPLPRNMTFDGTRIGFIDFEEDPLEVMDLPQAQARDWLMFGYGVARYYEARPERLQQLLRGAIAGELGEVRAQTRRVTDRLRRLSGLCRGLGRRARRFAHAVFVLHGATSASVVLLAAVALDWFSDGDLDLWRVLVG